MHRKVNLTQQYGYNRKILTGKTQWVVCSFTTNWRIIIVVRKLLLYKNIPNPNITTYSRNLLMMWPHVAPIQLDSSTSWIFSMHGRPNSCLTLQQYLIDVNWFCSMFTLSTFLILNNVSKTLLGAKPWWIQVTTSSHLHTKTLNMTWNPSA